MTEATKDLVILAADGNVREAVAGVLSRRDSLGIREITYDLFVHSESDPGCLQHSHDFLRSFQTQYGRAMVLLDREGCGRDEFSRCELEASIEQHLAASGWADRSAAIVIDPELEAWVWSNSPVVGQVIGWPSGRPTLREWLTELHLLEAGASKPRRPKEALEKALARTHTPRSGSLYRELAERVSLRRCADPAFAKLCQTLKAWFPAAPAVAS